jgi:hypothetical protein
MTRRSAVNHGQILTWSSLGPDQSLSLVVRAADGDELSCPSPDGAVVAIFYRVFGGGAAGWQREGVTIQPSGQPLDPDESVLDLHSGFDVRMTWHDPDRLLVEYPNSARVDTMSEKYDVRTGLLKRVVRTVEISYSPVETPGDGLLERGTRCVSEPGRRLDRKRRLAVGSRQRTRGLDGGFTRPSMSQALQPRRLQSVPGKPIDQLLTPSDQEVDLTSVRDVPMPLLDEHGQLLPMLTKATDLIAVVQLVSAASRLTEDRSWVMSTVEVRLLEILKAPSTSSSRYRQGGQVSFEWHGGTVDIGPHRVHARTLGVRGLSQSSRYLIFAGVDDKGRLLLEPSTVYEIIGDDIRSMLQAQFAQRTMLTP